MSETLKNDENFNEIYKLLFGESHNSDKNPNLNEGRNAKSHSFFDLPINHLTLNISNKNKTLLLNKNFGQLTPILLKPIISPNINEKIKYKSISQLKNRCDLKPKKLSKLPPIKPSENPNESFQEKKLKMVTLDASFIKQNSQNIEKMPTISIKSTKYKNKLHSNKIMEATLRKKLHIKSFETVNKAQNNIKLTDQNVSTDEDLMKKPKERLKIMVHVEMPKECDKNLFNETASKISDFVNKNENLINSPVFAKPKKSQKFSFKVPKIKLNNSDNEIIPKKHPKNDRIASITPMKSNYTKINLSYSIIDKNNEYLSQRYKKYRNNRINPMFYDSVRKKIRGMLLKRGYSNLEMPMKALLAIHKHIHQNVIKGNE